MISTRRSSLICLLPMMVALMSCKAPAPSASGLQYTLSDSIQADTHIVRIAAPYREQLSTTMSEVVCTTDNVLEKGLPEGTLGDFVADVCLEMGNRSASIQGVTKADFVVLNNGGLRKSLPKGAITLMDLYEVMPFENKLMILEMSGEQIALLCDFIAGMNGTPVSGIRFVISKDKKAKEVSIHGNGLDLDRTYRVMTADYLANGGDRFDIFKLVSERFDTDLKIRDALIAFAKEYTSAGNTISIRTDGRIRYE